MFRILVADLFIDIEPRYASIKELCRDYLIPREEGRDPDILIHISDLELQREISACSWPVRPETAEIICISKALGRELPRFDALFLHGATFTACGKTFAISADSGTGKTTLLRYCRDLLGDRLTILNGDKTIIRCRKGQVTAYGTPWCGKEGWGENTSSSLTGIILLSRGEKNQMEEVDPVTHLSALVRQVYIPEEGFEYSEKLTEILDHLLEQIKVYRIRCRKDPDAARVLFKGIGIDLGEKDYEIQG